MWATYNFQSKRYSGPKIKNIIQIKRIPTNSIAINEIYWAKYNGRANSKTTNKETMDIFIEDLTALAKVILYVCFKEKKKANDGTITR